MSVIVSRNDFQFSNKICSICGEKQYRPPFVHWVAETELVFCGKCCRNIHKGLMADMIQVVAIMNLQQTCGYHGFTLARERQQKVDEKLKAEFACGAAGSPSCATLRPVK